MDRHNCKFLVIVLLTVLLFFPTMGTLLAQDGTTVTATTRSDLNVRTEPNANAALAGVLPANTTVEVLEQFTNTVGELWLRIPYEDGEGWIAGWLVTINGGVEIASETEYVDPSGWIFEAENGLSAGFKGRITDITIAPTDWQTHLDQYEIAARSYAVATATIAFPNGQTLDVVVLIYNDNLRKTLIIGSQDLTSPFVAFTNTEEALVENGIVPGAEVIIDLGQLSPDANFADLLNELAVESDAAMSMADTGDLSAIQDRDFIVPVGVSALEISEMEHSEQEEIAWIRPAEWPGMYYVDCTVTSLDSSSGRVIDANRTSGILVSATCETPDSQILNLALGVRIDGTAIVGRSVFENSRMGPPAALAFLSDQGINVGTNITITIGNIPSSANSSEANAMRPICGLDQASLEAFAESADVADLEPNLYYGNQGYIIPAGVNLR